MIARCVSHALSAPFAASFALKSEKKSAHGHDIHSTTFSPDGKTIESGSDDKTTKVRSTGESLQL